MNRHEFLSFCANSIVSVGVALGVCKPIKENSCKLTPSKPRWQTMNRDLFFGDTTAEDTITVCRDEDGCLLIESGNRPPNVTRIEGDCRMHIGCTNDKCVWR